MKASELIEAVHAAFSAGTAQRLHEPSVYPYWAGWVEAMEANPSVHDFLRWVTTMESSVGACMTEMPPQWFDGSDDEGSDE